MWSLWPAMTMGTPGRVTPAAWKPGASRSAMNQMLGSVRPRCMSLERSGLPEAVWEPETTQLLEPGVQPEQMGRPRVLRRSAISSGVGLRFADSHPFRKGREMDGAPGFDSPVPRCEGSPPHGRRPVRGDPGPGAPAGLRFVDSHPFRKGREMDGAPGVLSGVREAWERSSSSSSSLSADLDLEAGCGWGWLRSTTAPVGGWSRQEPTG